MDDYIAGQPEPARTVLSQLRKIVKKALPGAEEVISYQIPAYRLRGRIVAYFAGWKEHYSIYPITGPLTKALKEELASYEQSGRGTVRFRLDEPVPARVIQKIAKFRAKEVEEAEKAKALRKRKR